MTGRQRELITRREVYHTTPAARVVLTCITCQHAYEPTRDDWRHANTSCPHCAGATITAGVREPGQR